MLIYSNLFKKGKLYFLCKTGFGWLLFQHHCRVTCQVIVIKNCNLDCCGAISIISPTPWVIELFVGLLQYFCYLPPYMCKARIPMSYVTLKEKLIWWPTKQIMKCYIWLCPSILPKYKLPPYPHPHPPTPVPPISNIPMLKVRELTYSKAFHARIEKQVKKNTFLWLSRQIITLA